MSIIGPKPPGLPIGGGTGGTLPIYIKLVDISPDEIVLGKLVPSVTGTIHRPTIKMILVEGPAEDITINSNSSKDITIPVDNGGVIMGVMATLMTSNAYIANIAASEKTIMMTLVNPGSSAVTVSAGSIKLFVLSIG